MSKSSAVTPLPAPDSFDRDKFVAIQHDAPRKGLPTVTANDLSTLEVAHDRYMKLIGILYDGDEACPEHTESDRNTYGHRSKKTDQGLAIFDDHEAAVFMSEVTGLSYGKCRTFLYADFVDIAASGLLHDPAESIVAAYTDTLKALSEQLCRSSETLQPKKAKRVGRPNCRKKRSEA